MQKYIVVTGGTKGIGRAILTRFAQAGFGLITCARSAADLADLSAKLQEQFPGTAVHTLAADLSRADETARFAAFVQSLAVPIEVLVNNTGAFVPGRLQDEPADGSQLRQMIDVNLYSAYDLTRALLPALIARRTGHIFNMCSTASIMAYPNGGSYCIAKFALYGMTKVLREELKEHNLRVTAILPGATLTASWEGVDLPAERFIRPEDVAEAVFGAWSLSPQAVVEELLIRPQLGDL
ncbi:Short-chain dehydrogenase [Hymenobacter daecheongensis DSM 21074]|uniref:Short-chain dehydrogenase n=1 Tax=Hymenobacter daecheongensis DSM 21074 TaxID=1121955 RepID=A0A1M6ENC2_9BACT|nr:SDR family oxidoreductase [Hymenobacter daecheongensis]SHI86923.1 Short-chain dehydrogenase [Hymenobacter daecheongensis DSM 21074]